MSKFKIKAVNWENVLLGLGVALFAAFLAVLVAYYVMFYLPKKQQEKIAGRLQFIEDQMRNAGKLPK